MDHPDPQDQWDHREKLAFQVLMELTAVMDQSDCQEKLGQGDTQEIQDHQAEMDQRETLDQLVYQAIQHQDQRDQKATKARQEVVELPE